MFFIIYSIKIFVKKKKVYLFSLRYRTTLRVYTSAENRNAVLFCNADKYHLIRSIPLCFIVIVIVVKHLSLLLNIVITDVILHWRHVLSRETYFKFHHHHQSFFFQTLNFSKYFSKMVFVRTCIFLEKSQDSLNTSWTSVFF